MGERMAAMEMLPRLPAATRASASWAASARDFMKAPEPNLTSRTRRSRPSASFLLMMLLVMSGMEGTVPVTSRRA